MAGFAAAAIGGGLVSGAANYFGAKASAKAQRKTDKEKLAFAREQAAKLEAAGQRGAGIIGDATNNAKGELSAYSDKALGNVSQGYGQGRNVLTNSYNQSRGDIVGGYGRAQGQLTDAYNQSRSDLGTGYNQARADLTPLLDNKGSRLTALYDSGALGNTFNNFQADPGYQFRLQQGQQGLDRRLAAGGGRFGGAAAKAAAEYNSGLASQEFGNYAQRALAQQGQQIGAASAIDQGQLALRGQLSGLASAYGNNLANAATNYGAQSSGLTARGADQLSGLASAYGGNMANLYTGEGNQLAGINQSTGQGLSNLTYNGGNAQAGIIMQGAGGAAQMNNNAMQATGGADQYAGAGWSAAGNAITGTINNLTGLYASGAFNSQAPGVPAYGYWQGQGPSYIGGGKAPG